MLPVLTRNLEGRALPLPKAYKPVERINPKQANNSSEIHNWSRESDPSLTLLPMIRCEMSLPAPFNFIDSSFFYIREA
jgi:hypothetical protein